MEAEDKTKRMWSAWPSRILLTLHLPSFLCFLEGSPSSSLRAPPSLGPEISSLRESGSGDNCLGSHPHKAFSTADS